MGIFASALKMRRLTSVGNPPAGVDAFYFKENGLPYIRNSEGVERSLIIPDSAMHSNPSFEEGATPPGNDLFLFWASGGTYSYDTTDFVDGTRSLKTVWAAEASPHIGTSEIRVVPGSVVEPSIWCKASVAGNIAINAFTGPTSLSTQWFSSGTQHSSSHTLGTSWRRISSQITVPAGHSYARFYWSPDIDRTVWLDASGSKVVYTPPPTDETGVIKMWPTSSAPAGYLFCDGSEQPVATYPQLDALLGTTFGARTNGSGGAGSTHFRLPDFRGRGPIGVGTASPAVPGGTAHTLGQKGGEENHLLTAAELPSHGHTLPMSASGAPSGTGDRPLRASGSSDGGFRTGAEVVTSSTYGSATTGNQSHNVLDPYLGINFIIKT